MGDMFKKAGKKKIKASNLNNVAAAPAAKSEAKPKGKEEEDGWADEQVAATSLKIEAAGKLTKDEDKKEQEEEPAAPVWNVRKKADTDERKDPRDERRFPSLAKAVQPGGIHTVEAPKSAISTSKNHFAALDNEPDEDEKKKEVKQVLVQKKKGELEKTAIQREADKQKAKKSEGGDEPAAAAAEAPVERERKAPEKKIKEPKKAEQEKEGREEEVEEDLKITVDREKSKAKYQDRKKLPKKELPASEYKENVAPAAKQSSKKKSQKWSAMEDDDDDGPKLQAMPDDW